MAEPAVASEWSSNPYVWIVGGCALIGAGVALGTLIFRIGKWVGAVNSDRAKIDGFMQEIRDELGKILDRLVPQPITRSSPLQLTDLGQTISASVRALEIAEELAPVLRDRTEGRLPYEVQQACFDYVLGEEYEPDEETETRIKVCAYENGVEREAVLRVIAIELRDLLLQF